MKSLGLLLSIKYVAADFSIMQKSLNEFYLNRTGNDERNLNIGAFGQNVFSALKNYGCWCYFNDDGSPQGSLYNRPSQGQPVDDLDQYCRELNYGYDCLLTL